MEYPINSQDAEKMGWERISLSCAEFDLDVSIAPDAEIDCEFLAFCHDGQEMISINGWMFN